MPIITTLVNVEPDKSVSTKVASVRLELSIKEFERLAPLKELFESIVFLMVDVDKFTLSRFEFDRLEFSMCVLDMFEFERSVFAKYAFRRSMLLRLDLCRFNSRPGWNILKYPTFAILPIPQLG